MERTYQQNILLKTLQSAHKEPTLRRYLNIFHAYMSICWIDEKEGLPPLHMDKLLKISSNPVKKCVNILRNNCLICEVPEEVLSIKLKKVDKEILLKETNKNREDVRSLINIINQKI